MGTKSIVIATKGIFSNQGYVGVVKDMYGNQEYLQQQGIHDSSRTSYSTVKTMDQTNLTEHRSTPT